MWIEKTPEPGDTVKVPFAGFTQMRPIIGIVLVEHYGSWKIEFGDIVRFIDKQSTFFVYEKF
jgi:hypothetical protein